MKRLFPLLALFVSIFMVHTFPPLFADGGNNETEEEEPISFGPDESVDLGEIVVTATRTNKNIFDTPVQTDLIDADYIAESGADSLDDLLASLGMEYAETGMGSHLQLQGMEGERVLFLIDGKKITGRVAGNLVSSMIPLDNIEKIEILRGPQSALYGSEAIGGVINIITKKPGLDISGGFTLKNEALPISDGSGEDWKSVLREQTVSGYLNVPLGKMGTRLSLFGGRAFPYLDEYDVASLPGYYQGKATLDNDVQLSLSTLLSLGGEYSYHRENDQTSASGSLDRVDTQKARSYITLNQGLKEKSSLTFSAYHNYFFREKTQYSALFDEWYDSGTEREHFVGTELLFSHYFSDRNEFTSAVSYSYNQLKKYNIDSYDLKQRHTLSLVLQDELFKEGHYSILPGIRGEYSSDYGLFVSPKLSGMVVFGKFFRILPSVGLGYRAPTFLELYLDSAGNVYHKFGNPDLVPEKSLGFNLGLEFLPENISLKANFFHSELFDEIVYDYTDEYEDGGLQIIVKENLSRSSRTGVDFTGIIDPLRFLQIRLQYGFLFAYNRTTAAQITNNPMHTVSSRIKGHFESIGFATYLDGKLQTKYRSVEHPVFVLNWYISKDIIPQVELFAGIDNITGQTDDYSVYLFGPVFYAGIKGSF